MRPTVIARHDLLSPCVMCVVPLYHVIARRLSVRNETYATFKCRFELPPTRRLASTGPLPSKSQPAAAAPPPRGRATTHYAHDSTGRTRGTRRRPRTARTSRSRLPCPRWSRRVQTRAGAGHGVRTDPYKVHIPSVSGHLHSGRSRGRGAPQPPTPSKRCPCGAATRGQAAAAAAGARSSDDSMPRRQCRIRS